MGVSELLVDQKCFYKTSNIFVVIFCWSMFGPWPEKYFLPSMAVPWRKTKIVILYIPILGVQFSAGQLISSFVVSHLWPLKILKCSTSLAVLCVVFHSFFFFYKLQLHA